jgi:hypothetical protein
MQKFIIDNILFRSRNPLSSIDLIFQNDLDSSERISEELRQHLEAEGIPLSPNTVVSIEKAGRRWELADKETDEKYIIGRNLFKIKLDSENDLDRVDRIPVELRQQLKDHGILLSPAATISIEAESNSWAIVDDGQRHVIWSEGDKLNVHEGELKIYPGTLTFTPLGRRVTKTPVGWLVTTLFIVVAFFCYYRYSHLCSNLRDDVGEPTHPIRSEKPCFFAHAVVIHAFLRR